MSINHRAALWAILLLIVGWLFYGQVKDGLNVETNILKLLPKTEVDPFAEKAFARFSDKNFKQLIVSISATDDSQAVEAAKTLIDELAATDLVHSFSSKLTQQEQERIGQLYFKHRFYLLTESDRKLLQVQGRDPFIDDTLQLVYSPLSGRLAGLIPTDPYLLSYRYLQNINASNNGQKQNAELVDGVMVFDSGKHSTALVSTSIISSPFDTSTQETISQLLNQFESERPELTIRKTGALFYAQHAAASAKQEITTIGLGSLIAVILLLIIAFRSATPLILTLTSLGAGIFIALTLVHLAFGSIHILTLVFGSSLVGVAVDYAFHYFASANIHKRPLPYILIAISMGLASSIIGYIALFTAPFPGLRQMALFCAIGLAGAFLTVVLLFDRIPYKVRTPNALLQCFKFQHRISQHAAHRGFIILLLVLPLIAGWMLSNTNDNNDNIRQLQSIPDDLYQQEQQIKKMVDAPATNQFFVVKANTQHQLLNQLHQFEPVFRQLVASRAIEGYQHLAQFVPGEKQQQSDYKLISKRLLNDELEDLRQLGLIQPQQIEVLRQDIQQQKPLSLSAWLDSPLGQRFDYLWLGQVDQKYAAIITINNIKNMAALESAAESRSNLYFINKVDKVSSMFAEYRKLALIMLLVAVAVIFLLLTLKYRLLIATYVLLGPVAAASLAIIVNILTNGSFNLFSTLALFLVFGIGIDYGLFYAEAKKRSFYISLAIGLSAITTFLSFGLLSLSATPAIHAFGLTMLTGILTVFLLSPILGHRIYLQKGLEHE